MTPEEKSTLDLQHRIIASLLRRNGGTLSFNRNELFPLDDTPAPPYITFIKDDLYRTVELRLETA
jgi:hypothetical protein